MHITLETDYAIRIVDCLAKNKLSAKVSDKPVRLDAKTIAENTEVPLRFALKILRKLVSGDIVKSYKGIYGGYELNREIENLSLYDIVELVEGTYRFSRCVSDDYTCSCNKEGELPCAYQRVFSEISDEVCKLLKKQTFDKLLLK